MVNIGLLGLGTVGSGVVEILDKRKEKLKGLTGHDIRIKKVLVNDSSKKRKLDPEIELVLDFDEILHDEEISIIVEVTGDVENSYKYISQGLKAGKNIVTANKAVVSKYFEEFSALAKEKDLAFLYEASVAGGIPVLKPLKEQLLLNEVSQVQGILNGTCNYILSRMIDEGKNYHDILKSAQDMGYAEADPTADVDGIDTMRKLRILATLSLQGKINEEDIFMDGISSITSFDIEVIKKMNSTVKLIGEAKSYKDGFTAVVQPTIVPRDNYFANVNLAHNSVAFNGSEVGELKFYGPGAGKLPTGNAVLSDVLDIVTKTYKKNNPLGTAELKNYNHEIKGRYYLRVSDADDNIVRSLRRISEEMPSNKGQVAIITNEIGLMEIKDLLDSLNIEKGRYFLGRILD
ncbi:homoserine dehydrogenase [Tissierella creatinini]|nr:homoserine dehydrogenase [Tissierella creatinini]TJX64619.1 homoserine dehydrogenase [Soehngenia saccharolytica]